MSNQNNHRHRHDSPGATDGAAAVGSDPWAQTTVGGQPDARAQKDIPTHPDLTQGSPPSAYLPPASASASAPELSSYQSSQDHQRQQHPPKDSRSKHDSTIWPVVQASAWFAYRASLWSMRTSYWAARSVVAKPYSVVAALFETPYTMMRDICLAFLPVYSFFTIAAVIGILVGGMSYAPQSSHAFPSIFFVITFSVLSIIVVSVVNVLTLFFIVAFFALGSAMWIAQLLISAIGADQETTTTSTVVGYSRSKPVAYHASQQPIRTFKQGQQRQQEPLSRASLSDRPISPATSRSETTRARSTTPLPSRPPAATMQAAPERDPRRRREIVTDDDDDDDDDYDDDNDWRRV